MTDINSIFSPETIEYLRKEIKKTSGNEVFFAGTTDSNKIVVGIKALARGDKFSVPAVLNNLKQGDIVIHNHPDEEKLAPSKADTSIAAYLNQFGVASAIINNSVTQIYVQVEIYDKIEIKKLEYTEFKKLLDRDGIISQKLPVYEFRPSQLQMTEIATESFNNNKIALIEAGTGTGKTISYLIPAIYWAVKNKERCIITTNTINLQEQIINKDIPFLQSVLPVKFEAILLKGRNNYLCLRRFSKAIDSPELIEDWHNDQMEMLAEWSETTRDGSRSDLSFIPDKDLWANISSEPDSCPGIKCPFNHDCFFNRVKRKANSCHIIIVNHHLFFADVSLRYSTKNYKSQAVLPLYRRVVIDEAHNAAEVATKYLGRQITRTGLIRGINKIYSFRRGKRKGYLPFMLNQLIFECMYSDNIKEKVTDKINNELLEYTETLKQNTEKLFDNIKEYLLTLKLETDILNRIRIKESIETTDGWINNVKEPAVEYIKYFIRYCNKLDDFCKMLKYEKNEEDKKADELIFDFQFVYRRLKEKLNYMQIFLDPPSDDNMKLVRWIEINTKKESRILRFCYAPVDISEIFYESVFLPNKTLVLTSATLTVDKKFEFIKENLGVNFCNEERIQEIILKSSFNFDKQIILVIPEDIPVPFDRDFDRELEKLIFRTISITKGKAFILFTSYYQLKKTYNNLKDDIELLGINLFYQGCMPRHKLLESFKKDKHSVLFATDSFWEGVDVQGESLECVVITKLPFKVPSDPVVEAKSEYIEKTGGNSFYKYLLPLAVIKLKQGFGRLIRNKKDRGVVAIFDKRIKVKSYSRVFMNSLPECRTIYADKDTCFKEMKTFF